MQEQIEIEVKSLVSEDEFNRLCNYFKVKEKDFVKQTNFYFDTPDQKIIKSKSSLRIREVNDKYILTFKLKRTDEVLELEHEITKSEFELLKQNKKSFNDYYKDLFVSLSINGVEVKYVGYLTTLRASLPYEKGELFFDKNYYQDTSDFEIEYETYDYQYGVRVISSLFDSLGIKFNINDVPKRARAVK